MLVIMIKNLFRLIGMAKPMVSLAKSISTKIRDKQGDITEVRINKDFVQLRENF